MSRTQNKDWPIRPAVWYSRHEPTPAQLENIKNLGFELVDVPKGRELGAISIQSDEQASEVFEQIKKLVRNNKAYAVFGVYSTDILALLFYKAFMNVHSGVNEEEDAVEVPCFAASNSSRSEEGRSPQFIHRSWREIGMMSVMF